MIYAAKETGCDIIELYTESYAANFIKSKEEAVRPYRLAADAAISSGLKINAGHDLSLENLNYFINIIPETEEVSIGHALISDALYIGLGKTIAAYLQEIKL